MEESTDLVSSQPSPERFDADVFSIPALSQFHMNRSSAARKVQWRRAPNSHVVGRLGINGRFNQDSNERYDVLWEGQQDIFHGSRFVKMLRLDEWDVEH